MSPLYLYASNEKAATLASSIAPIAGSLSSANSADNSDSTTRRASNVAIRPPTRPNKKTTHSTDPYLRNFTLVAEAARRAQMSIVTRSMEGVNISP
ncbi:hypothetical protein GGR50DRAFT_663181 [Xylaria sp. CBS 124048]|nr:hypothetical protein GGR50DRAFT_663181 [Xylaria sp. CBS 124048]